MGVQMEIKGAIITGAAGFLGSHICEQFLLKGIPVIGVDNYITGTKSNVDFLKSIAPKKYFVMIKADASKPWSKWLPDAKKKLGKIKITHVFHFASPASPPIYQEHALETIWINSVGVNEALIAADQLKARVIFSSTSEIYGDPLEHPQKETYRGNVTTVGPRSCYDEAKRFGETLIYTHNWKKKTKHGMVRIFNTYGPRMNPYDGRVVINFLLQAQKNKDLTVYGDGSQTRSFCYVTDLIEGIIRYAKSDYTLPLNLGNEKEFSILELAETVQKMFPEKKLQIKFEALPKDDPTQRRPDLSLTKEKLNSWEPRVQLSEGLQLMSGWLANELKGKSR
jgi:nucleoside-diphosphate-sugar epimerase